MAQKKQMYNTILLLVIFVALIEVVIYFTFLKKYFTQPIMGYTYLVISAVVLLSSIFIVQYLKKSYETSFYTIKINPQNKIVELYFPNDSIKKLLVNEISDIKIKINSPEDDEVNYFVRIELITQDKQKIKSRGQYLPPSQVSDWEAKANELKEAILNRKIEKPLEFSCN